MAEVFPSVTEDITGGCGAKISRLPEAMLFGVGDLVRLSFGLMGEVIWGSAEAERAESALSGLTSTLSLERSRLDGPVLFELVLEVEGVSAVSVREGVGVITSERLSVRLVSVFFCLASFWA